MLKLLPIKRLLPINEQRTVKAGSLANCGAFRLSFFFFPTEKYKLLFEVKLVSIFGYPQWDVCVQSDLYGGEIQTWIFQITFAFYCLLMLENKRALPQKTGFQSKNRWSAKWLA